MQSSALASVKFPKSLVCNPKTCVAPGDTSHRPESMRDSRDGARRPKSLREWAEKYNYVSALPGALLRRASARCYPRVPCLHPHPKSARGARKRLCMRCMHVPVVCAICGVEWSVLTGRAVILRGVSLVLFFVRLDWAMDRICRKTSSRTAHVEVLGACGLPL